MVVECDALTRQKSAAHLECYSVHNDAVHNMSKDPCSGNDAVLLNVAVHKC